MASKDFGPTGEYVGEYYRDDPRQELWERAGHRSREDMVVVPLALIKQVYRLRVCRSTHVITHDEDGKLPQPMRLHCVERAGHLYGHRNGYTHWEDR